MLQYRKAADTYWMHSLAPRSASEQGVAAPDPLLSLMREGLRVAAGNRQIAVALARAQPELAKLHKDASGKDKENAKLKEKVAQQEQEMAKLEDKAHAHVCDHH